MDTSQFLCVFATWKELTKKKEEREVNKPRRKKKTKNLDSLAQERGSLCLKLGTPPADCVNIENSFHLSESQFLHLGNRANDTYFR